MKTTHTHTHLWQHPSNSGAKTWQKSKRVKKNRFKAKPRYQPFYIVQLFLSHAAFPKSYPTQKSFEKKIKILMQIPYCGKPVIAKHISFNRVAF